MPGALPPLEQVVQAARTAEYEARLALLPRAAALPALVGRPAPQTLHVCYLMPRTDVGGGARVVLEHASRLTAAGCRVTVLSHFARPDWHAFSAEFVQVPFGLELAEALPVCDVVVAGYWDQVLAARAVGVAPVVHLEQGDAHLFEELPADVERAVRTTLGAADATITLSSRNREILAERYGTASVVVPNAVDPDVFCAGAVPPAPRPYVLVVGWDGNAFKGVDDAHAAWRELRAEGRDLDLVWVTPSPPLVPRGRVVVAPSQADLAALYRGAAAYVHASHYESFPLPPLEAMACGAPVVATRNAGVLEYARDDDNCLLVDIGDPAGIAAALRGLLDDGPRAERLRAGGLRTAAGFSWSAITEQLLATYRPLAALQPERAPLAPWRLDLDGLTAASPQLTEALELRLSVTAARELAVPVSWPAFEGHRVVRWQVVARRTRGLPGVERAFLPHTAPAPPRDLPYRGALDSLTSGQPDRALAAFVAQHRTARDPGSRAALGRWVALALLEAGRDEQAHAVAVAGAQDLPDSADYRYLAGADGPRPAGRGPPRGAAGRALARAGLAAARVVRRRARPARAPGVVGARARLLTGATRSAATDAPARRRNTFRTRRACTTEPQDAGLADDPGTGADTQDGGRARPRPVSRAGPPQREDQSHPMTLFTDRVQSGVEHAMTAVSLRQRVTADNLANAMTPGYRAQRVDFEGSLADAMRAGRPESAATSLRTTSEAPKLDGNNVDLEEEVTGQLRTGLQYQALVQAANHKLNLLRTAIEGR